MNNEKLRCAIIQTIDCHEAIKRIQKSTSRTVQYSLFSKESIFAFSMMPTSNLFDSLMPYLNLFDVALLPISQENLADIRTQLYYREEVLILPIVAMGLGLQPIALMDLVKLGLSDFICGAEEFGELSVRLSLMAGASKKLSSHYVPKETSGTMNMLADGVSRVDSLGHMTAPICFQLPFQEAKQYILAEFEKDYVQRSLRYHKGNVSKAAQQSGKNRRAFWELMRKHQIDAEQYRV